MYEGSKRPTSEVAVIEMKSKLVGPGVREWAAIVSIDGKKTYKGATLTASDLLQSWWSTHYDVLPGKHTVSVVLATEIVNSSSSSVSSYVSWTPQVKSISFVAEEGHRYQVMYEKTTSGWEPTISE